MKELDCILEGFKAKKILVLGDVMLDHYIWGRVERISPEAPVPVLDVQKEEYRLGGAANVALNLKALGAQVWLCGVVGKDKSGIQIRLLLNRQEIDASALVNGKSRPTTCKIRIGSAGQQIARIDFEQRTDIFAQDEKQILQKLNNLIESVDAIIIEDYNKGLLTANIIEQTIKTAKKHGKIVAVDPKQKNFFLYTDVDVFKPNYGEMQTNLGVVFESEAEFNKQAKLLRGKLKCRYLVVTRGEQGLLVYSEGSTPHRIPTFAREVYDVSGAGDTVISALTLALCQGCDILTAAVIANHAAGVVCGKSGTATASIAEIRQSYYEHKQDN
ncbi:MAG: D-glycero-beta-D-manno-heptose-7-phosphate kinase [Candidatus Cloacimonadaceae bacterium]